VEENDMLLEEYNALSEIAGAFEAETTVLQTKQREAQKLVMPDRERHLRNIKFFIENISRAVTPAQGSRRRPRTGPLPLATTPREQAVIEYVNSELDRPPARLPGSPVAAMSGTMRPRSAIGGSGPSRPRTAPSQAQVIGMDKVRALDMDGTKQELRDLLEEENNALKQQVEAMRLSLTDAADYRHTVVEAPAPSIKDIKSLEQKLEHMSVAPSSLVDIMERNPLSPSSAKSPKSRSIVDEPELAPEIPPQVVAVTPSPPSKPRESTAKMRLPGNLKPREAAVVNSEVAVVNSGTLTREAPFVRKVKYNKDAHSKGISIDCATLK